MNLVNLLSDVVTGYDAVEKITDILNGMSMDNVSAILCTVICYVARMTDLDANEYAEYIRNKIANNDMVKEL